MNAQVTFNSSYGELQAPSGSFASISSGVYHACGVKIDETIECWHWGDVDRHSVTDVPDGTFTTVASYLFQNCGLRTNGTAECWGYIETSEGSCEVNPGEIIGCPINAVIEVASPPGTFTDIGFGGTIECPVTYGTYSVDCSNNFFMCGLTTQGAVECWGSNAYGQADPPAGTFAAIDIGRNASCGIRSSGNLACWGSIPANWTPPEGSFTAISGGCGIRTDGTAECWGADRPLGAFTAIVASPSYAYETYHCGVRSNGTIECWGRGTTTGGGATTVVRIRLQVSTSPYHDRAGCSPTAPSLAGAPPTLRGMRWPGGSLPFRLAIPIPVGCSPTAPPDAGATTATAS